MQQGFGHDAHTETKNDEKAKRRPTSQLDSLLPYPEKTKRKRDVPLDKNLARMTGWQRIRYLEQKSVDAQGLIVLAMLLLAVMFCQLNGDIMEWKRWRQLEQEGEIKLALLVETGRYERGGEPRYYAEYSYHHKLHRDDISAERYQELQGATQIEVLAVDDLARLPGSKPSFIDNWMFVVIGVGASIAVFEWGMRKGYRANRMHRHRY